MRISANLLWKIFFLLLIVTGVEVVGNIFGINPMKNLLFHLIFLSVPVILLVFHAIYTLSPLRGFLLIFLSSVTGFVMEYFGLKFGTVFGGTYVYQPQLMLYTVPVAVIFYWVVFIYTGYSLTTSFLYWFKKDKPNFKAKNIWWLLWLVPLDGLFVMAIDLFMDPISVKAGYWSWAQGGPYFGIPTGNFVGWFLVAIIATGLFRLFEYWSPLRIDFSKSVYLITSLGYANLALSFAFTAIANQMYLLLILGLIFMLPTVFVNLFLYSKIFHQVTK